MVLIKHMLNNNTKKKLIKKKTSRMRGLVMGNLIFKPISIKMQPPTCSA